MAYQRRHNGDPATTYYGVLKYTKRCRM